MNRNFGNRALFFVAGFFVATADCFGFACNFPDQGPIPVVYFGGASSTDQQGQAWAEAAQRSEKYGRHFRFEGHGLPGRGLTEPLQHLAGSIQSCVGKINSNTFSGPIVLVAHSNGSVVINEIVRRTNPQARHKIKLVNLDGSLPSSGGAFQNVDVQCWTAQVSRAKTPPGPKACHELQPNALTSEFARAMRDCPATSCFFWSDESCKSPVCLHFRVINLRAADDLTWGGIQRLGYADIAPPLNYLDRYLPSDLR